MVLLYLKAYWAKNFWCSGPDLNRRTPTGKDIPSGRSSQSVDLESLVERTAIHALSPLTWLGYRCIQPNKNCRSFLLIISRGWHW